MSDYGVQMYVADLVSAFDLAARNTVTGETRRLTVYAKDATAAYAQGFQRLDMESKDRSWCFDGYERRD